MINNRRAQKIAGMVFATGALAATALGLLYCAALYLIRHTSEPPPTYTLRSNEPYQAVHVPFSLRDGIIYLPMFVGGWKMEGRLDTGGSDTIWDKNQGVPGQKTGRTFSFMDAGHNKISRAKQVVFRSVYFGNYQVGGLTTYAIDPSANPKSLLGYYVKQSPLVGNEAFCGCVLTIDYYKKEIIVRNASYDCTQAPHAANALLLPFHRRPSKIKNYYGPPLVSATINGVPVQMKIATGVSGHLCLNEAFAAKVLPHAKRDTHIDPCGNSSYYYPPVQVAFEPTETAAQNKTQTARAIPVQVYPNVKQAWDANVGYDLLRFFRVTIDYPRQKILLEPYGENKVKMLPKGSFYPVQQTNNQLVQTRLTRDMVLCRHADGTNTLSP